MNVYLRSLEVDDAKISYKWRNNNKIWKYTGRKPNILITKEIELKWIKDVLKRSDEVRYAICESISDKYIGNVQLTNIDKNSAEFHIFIGDTSFWGMGLGTLATSKMIHIGFNKLKLKCIYLHCSYKNINAIKTYEKVGFKKVSNKGDDIKMEIRNE